VSAADGEELPKNPAGGEGAPRAGLCDGCVHQKLVRNTRGSVFSLCLRSREDRNYPRYPRLPVSLCHGFEARRASPGGYA
jgi:hypothetical protein